MPPLSKNYMTVILFIYLLSIYQKGWIQHKGKPVQGAIQQKYTNTKIHKHSKLQHYNK